MHHSQLAPLPNDLPFRIVSETIGQGAYACIKKACPTHTDNPIFAVKFIHKEYAARHGKISPRQLQMEATVHKHIGDHYNIISFFQTGEDSVWRWIAMELAEGGDLFDKIEADEGVGEDIAHVYFSQLPMGQPLSADDTMVADALEDEPSMSQFSPHPSVPLSRTQKAQQFRDIVPSRPLTRFFSTWELKILVPLICEALHRLGVPVPSVPAVSAGDTSAMIRIVTRDGRMCTLQGKVIIECVSENLFEIEFMKVKGDPLEWRRFFKKVAVLCKDAVYKPEG
ncbi:Chk1 protein kinase [Aspergillus hancockii]|nr:Chk1 protein kinase [Aspergillus hancockii]